MLGTSGPLALAREHPLVGRTEGWSPKRREALDRTPPTGRLTVDTRLTSTFTVSGSVHDASVHDSELDARGCSAMGGRAKRNYRYVLAAYARRAITGARLQRERLGDSTEPNPVDLDFYVHSAWLLRESAWMAVDRLGLTQLRPAIDDLDTALPLLKDYRDELAHARTRSSTTPQPGSANLPRCSNPAVRSSTSSTLATTIGPWRDFPVGSLSSRPRW